jgi:hypothetical protein
LSDTVFGDWEDAFGSEVVEVFKWVVYEHGETLKTLESEETSSRRGGTFDGDEPLEDGQ